MAGKIAIGTAQFGLNYGVTNSHGQVTSQSVSLILDLARRRGCEWLDTAVAYGEAESVLGKTPEASFFKVSTKVGAHLDQPVSSLDSELRQSVARLGRARPDALLLHRSEWLRGPQSAQVASWVTNMRESSRIGAFGVSVYSPGELNELDLDQIDWVQVPMSVLAQDWLTSGHIERLHSAGVKVQVRSILAQGLVTTDPDRLPRQLAGLQGPLRRLQSAANDLGVTPLDLAVRFALQSPADLVVVGVETAGQLAQILACEEQNIDVAWQQFSCDHLAELDPRTWQKDLRIQ